jgi:hypothetical protein
MADDPETPNTLTSTTRGRSDVEGDVPEALLRRYYVDGRGGAGLGFYADAKIATPAFRDRGRQLTAARSDPNIIRDMTTIAQHRGWSIVMARGSTAFRREAWLAGRTMGIEVRGYRPTERDVQELDRRIDRRTVTDSRGHQPRERHSQADRTDRERGSVSTNDAAQSRLRVVEAVVRSRVVERPAHDRILAAARDRVATWLERGARFTPLQTRVLPTVVEAEKRRERLR